MTATQTIETKTAIPAATPNLDHAACNHGQDLTGYVVAYSHLTAANKVTFEDIEYVQGSTNYGHALEIVRAARERVMNGQVDATYAVIHPVYEGGHRPA